MHLQSKHWHLLAYIIIKKQDQKISAELGPCVELNTGQTTGWLQPKLRMENLKIHSHVFENNQFRISTKAAVCKTVFVSAQFYGSKAWTMYRNNIKHLDSISDGSTPSCILQNTKSICIWRNPSSETTPGLVISFTCLAAVSPVKCWWTAPFSQHKTQYFQSCSIKLPADSDTEKVQHPPKKHQHQQINLSGAPYAKIGNTKQWVWRSPILASRSKSHMPPMWQVVLGLGFITTQGGHCSQPQALTSSTKHHWSYIIFNNNGKPEEEIGVWAVLQSNNLQTNCCRVQIWCAEKQW